MPRWINWANFFTLVRLLLVPFIVEFIVAGRPVAALALFFIAAWTDVLDGLAARRLSAATSAGAYFDPISDKVLLSGVFLALAVAGWVPRWLVAIVLGRDLFIVLAVGFLIGLTRARKFPPSVWGKLSTFVQIVTVVSWMTRNSFPSPFVNGFASAMIWICAACTTWSGIHYGWRGIQLLRMH